MSQRIAALFRKLRVADYQLSQEGFVTTQPCAFAFRQRAVTSLGFVKFRRKYDRFLDGSRNHPAAPRVPSMSPSFSFSQNTKASISSAATIRISNGT